MIFSIIVIILFILSIIHKNLIYNVSLETTTQFINIIFPSIFMSFIIMDLISISLIPKKLGNLVHPFFSKVFKFKSTFSSYIYIMSFVLPFPTSVKLINDAYLDELITLKEANHLLKFNTSTSLIFLMSLSFILFDSLFIKTVFILCFYLSNIILGIILSFFYEDLDNISPIKEEEKKDTLLFFNTSITKNINISLWILGFNIFFSVIVSILLIYLPLNFYNLPIFHLLVDKSIGIDLLINSLFYNSFITLLILFFIPFLGIYNFIELKLIFKDAHLFSFVFYRFLTGILTAFLFGLFFIVI